MTAQKPRLFLLELLKDLQWFSFEGLGVGSGEWYRWSKTSVGKRGGKHVVLPTFLYREKIGLLPYAVI